MATTMTTTMAIRAVVKVAAVAASAALASSAATARHAWSVVHAAADACVGSLDPACPGAGVASTGPTDWLTQTVAKAALGVVGSGFVDTGSKFGAEALAALDDSSRIDLVTFRSADRE